MKSDDREKEVQVFALPDTADASIRVTRHRRVVTARKCFAIRRHFPTPALLPTSKPSCHIGRPNA